MGTLQNIKNNLVHHNYLLQSSVIKLILNRFRTNADFQTRREPEGVELIPKTQT